ncbi:hypothetical protein EJ02DRAFT_94863 [Clathrospora elynae]|uniref:ORC6 first cyclin-like domain-containing protein n=1 Tax=Clathrospora elynae TaxID=706981 RepID=A0A6A5SXT0_9PLEO|nr:hypothetical protein EJ02DRAFT_94863 [Clathrospora elynae]
MSKANVEQALTGLIPTLNGPLPPDLVQLALSLLTRSQSVASSLKSDEEIARPYACAQLACERLKKRLNLPTIASRPPCPPRIYKKLYNYLSSALPQTTTTREPQTPRKATALAPASARNTPKTPLSARKTPRSTRRGDEDVGEPPEWVMPTIRAITKAFDYPSAVPHVYTGVETIFPLLVRMSAAAAETPSKRPRRTTTALPASSEDVTDARVLSLIVILFLFVFAKMTDVHVTPEQYKEWREEAINTIQGLPAGQNTSFEEVLDETVQMMPMATEEGWMQMEWLKNVKHQESVDGMEGIEMTDSMAHPGTAKSKLSRSGGSDYIGLGTMMQDATDYLGERQQEDYEKWKARIMARVQEVEAA